MPSSTENFYALPRYTRVWPRMRKSSRASAPGYEAARAAADELIARLGEQAPCHAMLQALKARLEGDQPRMDEWLWIAGVTREILRSEPKG
jgi:hypothetical protein